MIYKLRFLRSGKTRLFTIDIIDDKKQGYGIGVKLTNCESHYILTTYIYMVQIKKKEYLYKFENLQGYLYRL